MRKRACPGTNSLLARLMTERPGTGNSGIAADAQARLTWRWPAGLVALAAVLGAGIAPARADVFLPPLGGRGGGGFQAPCAAGQNLVGVEVRTGDDVDAIRPVCAVALGAQRIRSPVASMEWHGGQGGGRNVGLMCPVSAPVVLAITVGAEGQDTVIVNNLWLYCGVAAAAPQSPQDYPSAIFNGPPYDPSGGVFGLFPSLRRYQQNSQRCPPGQVATGIHGRSGVWLDAVALMCDTPRLETPGKTIGRVPVSGPARPARSICEAARDARARNSPAAPNLEARCLAAGGR